ncbi:DUF4625 domain-containing protein [Rufibacter immobilis]|uniref:DUF4625 domain-containing protein n=1 Tax=Rufibacter immobilis TaxID=1348778 RepID=UPI00160717E8|nr:DUF4625 domain-containing protein [Rufibacter immobilis]
MKALVKQYLFLLLAVGLFTSCDEDDEPAPVLPKPTIDNIEVGLGNNGVGVIGRDFHLNADILAGDKIENVQVRIQQRSGETYSKVWQHEITWDQYKGAKNAKVHKHFDIPADAAEGNYDFLIMVNNQNGAKLEEKRSIILYEEKNLPVNPQLSIFNLFAKGEPFYWDGKFVNAGQKLQKGDVFNSQVAISGVKGDGKMYLLLINKKLNHRPESVEQIDFSKAIVYDVYEHKGWAAADFFTNSIFDPATFTPVRDFPNLTIGAANDNNAPQPSPVNGAKPWESGTYYYGVVYKNTTYDFSFFHYIELPIEMK